MDSNREKGALKVICPHCNKVYAKRALTQHLANMHNIDLIHRNMACLDCGNKFAQRIQLINHLKKDHNKKMEKETWKFSSVHEFTVWLEDEEKKSIAKYMKVSGEKKTDYGSKYVLICCRDGTHKRNSSVEDENRKRAPKKHGSRKCGNTCTSFLMVQRISSPPCVNVQYYKTHYGHKAEVHHLHLDKKEKNKIAYQLALGIPAERIIENTLDSISNSTPSRLNTLCKKDIANIQKAYKIGIGERRIERNETDEEKEVQEIGRVLSCITEKFQNVHKVPLGHLKLINRFLKAVDNLMFNQKPRLKRSNFFKFNHRHTHETVIKKKTQNNIYMLPMKIRLKKTSDSNLISNTSVAPYINNARHHTGEPWLQFPLDHEEVVH